jgi:hypothetical protein
MSWLHKLFGDPNGPMFPGLPDEPPAPETMGFLALVVLSVCVCDAAD